MQHGLMYTFVYEEQVHVTKTLTAHLVSILHEVLDDLVDVGPGNNSDRKNTYSHTVIIFPLVVLVSSLMYQAKMTQNALWGVALIEVDPGNNTDNLRAKIITHITRIV